MWATRIFSFVKDDNIFNVGLCVLVDTIDEYVKIGECTVIENLKKCGPIVEVFGPQYLRSPNTSDVAWVLLIGKSRGFPGILGSLDWMH